MIFKVGRFYIWSLSQRPVTDNQIHSHWLHKTAAYHVRTFNHRYDYCLIIQRRVTLFLFLGLPCHRGVCWQNNKKTQLMQINKPKGIKRQTTERKLGNGLNWQVTLRQQGVK
jgi:hypothetical protein